MKQICNVNRVLLYLTNPECPPSSSPNYASCTLNMHQLIQFLKIDTVNVLAVVSDIIEIVDVADWFISAIPKIVPSSTKLFSVHSK